MPVTRRYYSNPTKPKRCLAMIPSEDDSPSVKCKGRIVRAGLCGKHRTDSQTYREVRRKTVTRHRLGIDILGKMTYGTIDKSVDRQWCHTGNCRRVPIINISDMLFCEKCFMKAQKRQQFTRVSNEHRPDLHRLEGTDNDKGTTDSVV